MDDVRSVWGFLLLIGIKHQCFPLSTKTYDYLKIGTHIKFKVSKRQKKRCGCIQETGGHNPSDNEYEEWRQVQLLR